MRNNKIKIVMDNVTLSDEAKKRIKHACAEYEREETRSCGIRFGMRIAIAAAILAAMSVTAYAVVGLGYFSFEKNDDTVIIGAALSDEVKEQIATEPVRAWNPGEGEISVKLNFGYMPEDMTERDNTPGKWYGTADYNRHITFSGFDLRRGDLSTVVKGIDDAERFTAGANDAYLLYSESEISVYDKDLYVLFYDGQFVVKATVGRGITVDEIKAIAAGMTVEETEDVSLALPISNEFGDSSDVSDNKVYYSDPIIIKESELLHIGDTGEYKGYFGDGYNITVEKLELVDTISGLDESCFHDVDWVKQFTDENGKFVPYKRTGVDYEAGKFTETVDMTKKMALVTVQIDNVTEETADDIKAHLNTFDLLPLRFKDDGTVDLDIHTNYVIDRTPGRDADSNESIYIKSLGDGKWVIGYLLDEDKCQGDFFYRNTVAKIYYSLEK